MSLVPRKIIYLLLHLPGGVFNYLNNKWKTNATIILVGMGCIGSLIVVTNKLLS